MRHLDDTTPWPQIAVYDIESDKWTDVLLVCFLDESGNKHHFYNIPTFVDFLFSDKFKGTHVWAHAGGRYDHRFLLKELYDRGWDFKVAMSGGSIVILSVTSLKGRKIQFADSYRIMPEALAKIGKTIKLEKLDIDRANISRERFETDETFRELVTTYCYRDCEIVLKGLQHMRDVLTSVGADFAFTLASIATRWVRRSPVIDFNRFYRPNGKGSIEYDKKMLYADYWCEGKDRRPKVKKTKDTSKPVDAYPCKKCGGRGKWVKPLSLVGADKDDPTGIYFVCRDCGAYIDRAVYTAYHGGHTEMFHDSIKEGIVKGPVYYYDVVSSYPWSMTNELPLYLEGFFPPPSKQNPAEIERFLSYMGITEAFVNVPYSVSPPLPLQIDGRALVFPCGEFQGRFTNIELMAAFRRGAQIRLGWQCRFESKAFLAPFVNTFYGLRKQAKADKDEFRTYAYKILLNSLYGKLVETIDRCSYSTSRQDRDRAIEKGGTYQATAIAGFYQILTQEEGPFRHVAAGAYVTAYSRLKLLEGIEWVLANGGKVLYCDTDSIMSTIPMTGQLVGKELGNWQPEYVFSEVEIILPKVYRAKIAETGKTLYRCKGMPMVRENEPPDVPERRWYAFKEYAKAKADPRRQVEAAELAALLERDNLTGFVADINAGSIYPRHAPMLRSLQSSDKKRDWSTSPSQPLRFGNPLEFTAPPDWVLETG